MPLLLTEMPVSQFTHGNNVINDHKTQVSNFQTFKASYKKVRHTRKQKAEKRENWN